MPTCPSSGSAARSSSCRTETRCPGPSRSFRVRRSTKLEIPGPCRCPSRCAGRVVVGDLRQALYRGCQSPFPGAGGHPTPASDRLQCHPVEAAGMASDAHALKSARPCPKIEPSRPRKGVRFPSTARFKESPAKATIWLPFAFLATAKVRGRSPGTAAAAPA